ncbi:MAG: putative molybdopterin biosynthesis protein moaD [Pseudomonadota bacterium]
MGGRRRLPIRRSKWSANRNKLIEIIEIKHSTNKSYKDLIKKSAFCSEQDEIVNDSYVLKKDKIISIIPPIGGG